VPSDGLTGSSRRGLQLGALIGVSWLTTLILGLRVELTQFHPLLITGWILWRSFLHTGLFILAHDAMHNSLAPRQTQMNHSIGRVCLWLYAGLNYDACRANHRRHHLMPESEADPDFCPVNNHSLLAWLVRFLRNYLNPAQVTRLALVLVALWLSTPASQNNAFVAISVTYLIPLLISTGQLFFVGTYLPHRKDHTQQGNEVSTRSLNLHPLISLLACYHFGYHREHHNHPKAPWFRLPELRTSRFVY